MNIALEQTEEYVNGQLKNKYGDAFIRGNNGRSQPISALPEHFSTVHTFLLAFSSIHQHNTKKIDNITH